MLQGIFRSSLRPCPQRRPRPPTLSISFTFSASYWTSFYQISIVGSHVVSIFSAMVSVILVPIYVVGGVVKGGGVFFIVHGRFKGSFGVGVVEGEGSFHR